MRGPDADQMQPHQPSLLALKISSEAGCRLCQFIWMALLIGTDTEFLSQSGATDNGATLSHISEEYPGREISLVAWGGVGSNLDRIHVVTTGEIPSQDDGSDGSDIVDSTMHPDHQIGLDGVLELFAYPDDPAAWHGGLNGRPLPKTAGDSEDDFNLVRAWLQTCFTEHPNCYPPDVETPLPTRVIDVGPSDGQREPYLLESDGHVGRYVTLSHCWGGRVPLTTTSRVIEERKRSIPLVSLPKTFLDAVLITRRLGLRYLWIDSLCIIQDSKSDWEMESARMEAIYRHCYLNISARGASNVEDGCFIARPPEAPVCRLPWTCHRCSECPFTGWMYIRSPERRIENVRTTPCDTRGWILQEQLLSPRVLYYGSGQLYWECCQTTLRQDGRLDENALIRFGNFPEFKQALGVARNSSFQQTQEDQHADERQRIWYQIVEEYTRRQLTFQSDKLAAISGLAKAFQRQTGKQYIAGFWKEDLFPGLTWYRRGKIPESVADHQPSWSWAKMCGHIGFAAVMPWGITEGYLTGASCETVDVTVREAGRLNPYDNLSEARLRMKGHLVEVLYQEATAELDYLRNDSIFMLNGLALGSVTEDLLPSKWQHSGKVYCVLLNTGVSASGIVLVPKEDEKDTYSRVGMASLKDDRLGFFLESDLSVFSII